MSELTRAGASSSAGFDRGTMLLVALCGIVAFVILLVLGAYAPELRSGRNGGSHALSNAATGYSGLVTLAQATGRNPQIVRSEYQWESEDLAVLTPESPLTDLTEVLQTRSARATLVVLPKWDTQRDRARPGWVRIAGLLPDVMPEGVLAPALQLDVTRARTDRQPLVTIPDHAPDEMRFDAPPVLQTMSGKELEPIITDGQGRVVLAKWTGGPMYVLAEPDLLNNYGIRELPKAAAALSMLDFLNSTEAGGVLFDVTLNGLGGTRSPLRLAFDPPFLAVTLAILVALALAGLQAVVRFGVPARPQRAIAFGKAALVDNTASLVRKAGREARLGERYADIIRERAAALLRIPPRVRGEELEQRLERAPASGSYSKLANAAAAADDREQMLAAAKALHQWKQEIAA